MSRDATSCFQRVHRQNGERHSKWYELAFSESKTFPLRPFSFIDAIVFERCWLDSLFLLLFVVSSSSFFFLGRRGNRGVFNSWYVSLAVTHGARCFGDDELLCFIGMAAILANRSTRNRNKNGVCFRIFWEDRRESLSYPRMFLHNQREI